MAVAFVQNLGTEITKSNGSSRDLPVTADVSAGNSIIVAIAWKGDRTLTGVSDDAGNTYSLDINNTTTNGLCIASAHDVNALSSGQNISISWDGNTSSRAIAAAEFSGLETSSVLDKTAVNQGSGTAASSGATTTLSQADELVIGACAQRDEVTQGFTHSGYTPLNEDGTTGGGTNETIRFGYKIVASAFPVTFLGTNGASMDWAAGVATYKEAGEAAAVSFPFRPPARAMQHMVIR